MRMDLYVHTTHIIKDDTFGVSGYDEGTDFMKRLNDYAEELGESGVNETGWGEGYANYEIPVTSVEEILKQDDDFFDEVGCVEDKPIIQKLYDMADKTVPNGYMFIDLY